MKNSHKFWLIVLIPLIIYLCVVSTVALICLLVVESIFGVVFLIMFVYNDLIWYVKNDKAAKYLSFFSPICWVLLAIAYFNKWMDNEL